MKRSMRGFLHRSERNQTNLVRLAHFLKRPANARIARQSPAAIRRRFKGGNGRGHWKAFLHGHSPGLVNPTTNGPLPIRHVPTWAWTPARDAVAVGACTEVDSTGQML